MFEKLDRTIHTIRAGLPLLDKLDTDQITKILKRVKLSSEGIEVAMPLLEKLDSTQLTEVLSHCELCKKALPLLKKVDLKTLIDPNDLFYQQRIDLLTPLILEQKIEPEQIKAWLSKKDEKGLTPLHYSSLLESALPLLNQLNPEQIVDVLSIKGKGDRRVPLHDFASLSNLLPLLTNKLKPKQIEKLLAQRDVSGATVLNMHLTKNGLPFYGDEARLKNLKDVFNILDPKQIKNLLSIPSLDGFTPVRSYLRHTLPLLELLEPEQIVEVLSIQDHKGNTPLHLCSDAELPKTFQWLEKWLSPGQIQELFSIENVKGDTIFHSEFYVILPLLENSSPELIKNLFSIRNEGNTALHFDKSAKDAVPYLMKLNPGQIVELLSITDEQGNTPLNTGLPFHPILDKLDAKQIEQVLGIPNYENLRPLEKWTPRHLSASLKELKPATVEAIARIMKPGEIVKFVKEIDPVEKALPFLMRARTRRDPHQLFKKTS